METNKKDNLDTEGIAFLERECNEGSASQQEYIQTDHQGEVLLCYRIGRIQSAIEWIQSHLPSSVDRLSSGFDWIYICRPLTPERNPEIDVDGLLMAWENVLKSGRRITFKLILELARNYNVTAGKWILFAESGVKIDLLWEKVSTSIIDKTAPFSSAKVSTVTLSEDRHIISIFDYDFTNKDSVFKLEQAIRNVGIKCMLRYKPDIYTYIGVYKNNPWGIRPTILESQFDIMTGRSRITSHVMEV